MGAQAEETLTRRELTVACHSLMNDIAGTFNRMVGGSKTVLDYDELSEEQMLAEMHHALTTVQAQIGPALENPMIQMILRRMNG